jgi:hypothetical protein
MFIDAMRKPQLVVLAFELGLGRSRSALDVRSKAELIRMIKTAQSTTKEQ